MRHIRKNELQEFAAKAGFTLDPEELDEFYLLTEAQFGTLDRFETLPEEPPRRAATVIRDAGRRPTPEEDPLNAITRWCRVKGTGAGGLLAGKRVALKDMISVAGVPLTCGSPVLRDYTPNADADLTVRLLEAGAEIVAITNMEAFAFSGGGETCGYGPVKNPFDPQRTACGSSNGSAASLYYAGVDLAWGTDTGGSVRIPASWCGVLGLKPTHGVIPFTGILTSDWRYDHAGPMARSVGMLALAMDAAAEPAVIDANYPGIPRLHDKEEYRRAVDSAPGDLRGVKIGIVTEGFASENDPGAPEGTKQTADAARRVLARFGELGAECREISLPTLTSGSDVMFAAMQEAATGAVAGWQTGYHWLSESSPQLSAGVLHGMRAYGDELPDTFKLVMILGHYLNTVYGGAVCARAHRMARGVTQAVDGALAGLDFLALPTTTHYAHLIDPAASISQRALRGWGMLGNAPAFNASGHPAINLPAAEADGLPVGVMLVGERFRDARLLSFARTFEQAFGWEPKQAPRLNVALPAWK
jgi:amidase